MFWQKYIDSGNSCRRTRFYIWYIYSCIRLAIATTESSGDAANSNEVIGSGEIATSSAEIVPCFSHFNNNISNGRSSTPHNRRREIITLRSPFSHHRVGCKKCNRKGSNDRPFVLGDLLLVICGHGTKVASIPAKLADSPRGKQVNKCYCNLSTKVSDRFIVTPPHEGNGEEVDNWKKYQVPSTNSPRRTRGNPSTRSG